jgi:hypothetical protein
MTEKIKDTCRVSRRGYRAFVFAVLSSAARGSGYHLKAGIFKLMAYAAQGRWSSQLPASQWTMRLPARSRSTCDSTPQLTAPAKGDHLSNANLAEQTDLWMNHELNKSELKRR